MAVETFLHLKNESTKNEVTSAFFSTSSTYLFNIKTFFDKHVQLISLYLYKTEDMSFNEKPKTNRTKWKYS